MNTHKNKIGKTLSLVLSLFMVATFTLLSCSSDDGGGGEGGDGNENTSITENDLLGIYVAIEYEYLENVDYYGDKPHLEWIYFTEEEGEIWSNSRKTGGSYKAYLNPLVYSSVTKITTVNVHNSILIPLKRDDNGKIVLAGQPTYNYSTYKMVHAELYYVAEAPAVSGHIYQEINGGEGYYSIHNGKWMYAATNNFPTLDWEYESLQPYHWEGSEDIFEGNSYFGLTIPKGQGWKGEHKDDALMVLYYKYDNNSISDDIIVCKMLED